MSAHIRAISYHLPERVITNAELANQFSEWNDEKIFNNLGVRLRHVADDDETASDLAVAAAEKMFTESGIDRTEVDFVIFCCQNPDYIMPSTSCALQDMLHLKKSVGAFGIDLGCSGYVYGLAAAKGLVTGGVAKNVLLLTGDRTLNYLYPDDQGCRLIFGEGATSTLISGDGFAEIGEFVFGTDGSGVESLYIKNGGAKNPIRSGDIRGDYLYMDGGAVLNFTLREVPKLIDETLAENGVEKGGVSMYILHQANKLILTAIRKICGISSDKFFINLEETGNTMSSTVPIALSQCIAKNLLHGGSTAILAGFGLGLSWAGTMLRFH